MLEKQVSRDVICTSVLIDHGQPGQRLITARAIFTTVYKLKEIILPKRQGCRAFDLRDFYDSILEISLYTDVVLFFFSSFSMTVSNPPRFILITRARRTLKRK